MLIETFPDSKAMHRNFNLCPHCTLRGLQGPLLRLREGIPMVSRSDGETFHVLLADRPLPYPLERSAAPSKQLSVCFWYSHAHRPMETLSTIVILEGSLMKKTALFHKIETVADLLAEALSAREQLAEVYELFEHSSAPWSTPEYTPLCNFPVARAAR